MEATYKLVGLVIENLKLIVLFLALITLTIMEVFSVPFSFTNAVEVFVLNAVGVTFFVGIVIILIELPACYKDIIKRG